MGRFGIICYCVFVACVVVFIFRIFRWVPPKSAVARLSFVDIYIAKKLGRPFIEESCMGGRKYKRAKQDVYDFAKRYQEATGISLHTPIYDMLAMSPKVTSVRVIRMDEPDRRYPGANYAITYTYRNTLYRIPFRVTDASFFSGDNSRAEILADPYKLLDGLEQVLMQNYTPRLPS